MCRIMEAHKCNIIECRKEQRRHNEMNYYGV